MSNEFSEIGSVKALLDDARERIKESEGRSSEKIRDLEIRIAQRLDELETATNDNNLKLIQWLPLLSNLQKTEENKRNMVILLLVAFISNIAAWILTIFIFFIKQGVIPK